MLNILWNNWWIWPNLADTLIFLYTKTCTTTKISIMAEYHVVLATLLLWYKISDLNFILISCIIKVFPISFNIKCIWTCSIWILAYTMLTSKDEVSGKTVCRYWWDKVQLHKILAEPARSVRCDVLLIFRRSRVRSSGPSPSIVEIWSWKFLRPFSPYHWSK